MKKLLEQPPKGILLEQLPRGILLEQPPEGIVLELLQKPVIAVGDTEIKKSYLLTAGIIITAAYFLLKEKK